MKTKFMVLVFASVFAATACKKSKKHKSSSKEECDAACQEKKKLANTPTQVPTGFQITVKGQAANSVIQMAANDSAPVAITGSSPSMVIGLLKGPAMGVGLQGGTTLYTSNLPQGNHQITILGRDTEKCAQSGGQECQLQTDNLGRFTLYKQIPINAAYDKMFDFTLQIQGQGTGATGLPGGNIQTPGENPSFFSSLWNNIKTGGSWFWNWFQNLFGGNQQQG